MIVTSFDYAAPETAPEAVRLLAGTSGARPLAGGQALLVALAQGEEEPPALVDLRRIPGLDTIERRPDGLRVGATATLADIAASGDVAAALPALAAAARAVGDPQVRNRGTLGGNLAGAAHGTDLPAVALAAGARLNLLDSGGARTVGADDYFAAEDHFAAGAAGTMIITSADFPALSPGQGCAFEKVSRQATPYPLCAVAVWAERAAGGALTACRIAVTGATVRPVRLRSAEDALAGTVPTAEAVRAQVRSLPAELFAGDAAASAEYRAHLTGVLVARALERTGGTAA